MVATLDQISEVMKTLGRRGGLARAKNLTAKDRSEQAAIASKAAAVARSKKAKQRKKESAK